MKGRKLLFLSFPFPTFLRNHCTNFNDWHKHRNSSTVLLLSSSSYPVFLSDPFDRCSLLLSQTLPRKLKLPPRITHTDNKEVQNVSGPRFPQSCFSLLFGLFLGSLFSFILSNPGSTSLLPFLEAIIALVSYSTATCIVPFSAILFAEILTLRTQAHSILFPSLLFALSGIAQERVGVGRAVWWIQEMGELKWLARIGGNVLVDPVWAAAGFSIAKLMYLPFDTNFIAFITQGEEGEVERDLLHSEEEGDETTPQPQAELNERSPLLLPQRITRQSFVSIASRRPKHLTKPILILSFLLLLQLFSPIFTYLPSTIHYSHPSPIDPEYVYPPVSPSRFCRSTSS